MCVDGQTCAMGDVNADGKADAIAFVKNTQAEPGRGDVWVAQSTGAGFQSATRWSDYFCLDNEQCQVADVNGDGRADLLAFTRGAAADVWQAISTGTSFNVANKLSDLSCLDGETCTAADMNGDHIADLVTFVKETAPEPKRADVYVNRNFGGSWRYLPDAPVLAIHAALLRNNKILVASGSQYNCCLTTGLDNTYLYSLPTSSTDNGSWTKIASPYGNSKDVFCAGHAHDSLGRVGFYGGNKGFGKSTQFGIADTARFDPGAGAWSGLAGSPAMWYPTLSLGKLTGGEWDLFLFLGRGQKDSATNPSIVYHLPPQSASWISTGKKIQTTSPYPRTLLMPNGKIFVGSPADPNDTDCVNRSICGANNPLRNYYYDPATNAVTLAGNDAVPITPGIHDSWYGSLALLPLKPVNGGYPTARVLFVGGATAYVKDLGSANPAWAPTAGRVVTKLRRSGSATLLPTGQVLVTGGTEDGSDAATVKEVEVFGTDNGGALIEEWSLTAAANRPRQYHSVAVLLPDGRVWTAGSNTDGQGSQCDWDGTRAEGNCNPNTPFRSELTVEVFEPWYYYRADRPAITTCPTDFFGNGATRTIGVGGTSGISISQVVLMAAGSVTHAFDSDQRLINLDIAGRGGSSVVVKTPYSDQAAPPGDYLLFILKQTTTGGPQLPSVGCWTKR
jgi:hypothetical protein